MKWHENLMTLVRNADSKVFRVVFCSLVLACSVALVAACIWVRPLFLSKDVTHKTTLPPKPTSRILYSQTESISIHENGEVDLDALFCGDDSWHDFLSQDGNGAISRACVGRMFFPPAVSIALRQMIDDPVNDRLDTMLHVACQKGDLIATFFLIDAGADLNVTNRFGETPFDLVDYTKRDYVEGITRMIGNRRPQSSASSDSETHCG
jgi:hypothetical protein